MAQKYEIIHRTCGQLAFFYTREPLAGENISREHFLKITGRPLAFLERPTCGSCGRILRTGTDLAPGLRVFDMGDTNDMEELYEDSDGY